MRAIVTASLAIIALAAQADAQVLTQDGFAYSGALTSNGWAAHSGAGNKVINANGAFATLEQSGGSGEDVNLPFAQQGATDTTYAAFRFRVPSGNPVNPDGSGLYFAHFKDSAFAFRARTGLLSPAGSGDFALAINGDNSNLGAGSAVTGDLSFDVWYRVVISWDATTGESKLWLNPLDESGDSISHVGASSGDLIEQFAFRQSNDYTGFIDVDGVVVGQTFADVLPPPTAVPFGSGLGLGALAGLLFLGVVGLSSRKRQLAV